MDYYTDYDAATSGLFGGLAIFSIILIVLVIAILVVSVIATWKLFTKAGKPGWQSIIPFYSYWVLTEIAGLNWWWFLLIIADSIVSFFGIDELATVANLVTLFATFNCYYNVAKKFNKTTGTAVCAGIFSFIFVLMFAFSKNEVYNASIPVSKNGIFGTPEGNTTNTMNNQNNTVVTPTGTVDSNNVVQNNVEQSNANQEFSFCGNCGTKMDKDTRFCPNCGKENI